MPLAVPVLLLPAVLRLVGRGQRHDLADAAIVVGGVGRRRQGDDLARGLRRRAVRLVVARRQVDDLAAIAELADDVAVHRLLHDRQIAVHLRTAIALLHQRHVFGLAEIADLERRGNVLRRQNLVACIRGISFGCAWSFSATCA